VGVGRVIGTTIGTLLILGVGVYGPATLLGPLPDVSTSAIAAPELETSPPVLPAVGASALTEDPAGSPLAVAGETDAVPMAAATKVVAALVVLDAHPLGADDEGDVVPITTEDFLSFMDYKAAGARTVTVYTEDEWSERGMLQALLLGSSNNHADTLVRWAFGSVEEYLSAADDWLDDNGLTGITVADATGLSDESAGTATDLATVAALALQDPAIDSILTSDVEGLPSRRGIENTTTYLPELGVTGVTRSYTDSAGICLLFGLSLEIGDVTYRAYGAILRQEDWDSLESSVRALAEQTSTAVTSDPLVEDGTPLVEIAAPWGQTVTASAGSSVTAPHWVVESPRIERTIEKPTASGPGTVIGSIEATAGGRTETAPLRLDERLQDPGVLWRLSHPIPVIAAWVEEIQAG
jgi:D-alanyl-D-alanine carboxypeptidase (penicillin-binding protein 5/6)